MRRWILALVGLLLTACPPTPKPPPGPDAGSGGAAPVATGGTSSAGGNLATGGLVATGGTLATGGTTSIGNLAHCIRDLTADPAVANVAAQQGITAKALATKECADPSVLVRHP